MVFITTFCDSANSPFSLVLLSIPKCWESIMALFHLCLLSVIYLDTVRFAGFLREAQSTFLLPRLGFQAGWQSKYGNALIGQGQASTDVLELCRQWEGTMICNPKLRFAKSYLSWWQLRATSGHKHDIKKNLKTTRMITAQLRTTTDKVGWKKRSGRG